MRLTPPRTIFGQASNLQSQANHLPSKFLNLVILKIILLIYLAVLFLCCGSSPLGAVNGDFSLVVMCCLPIAEPWGSMALGLP